MSLKAGFIGLGHMGTGMSKNVLKAAAAFLTAGNGFLQMWTRTSGHSPH